MPIRRLIDQIRRGPRSDRDPPRSNTTRRRQNSTSLTIAALGAAARSFRRRPARQDRAQAKAAAHVGGTPFDEKKSRRPAHADRPDLPDRRSQQDGRRAGHRSGLHRPGARTAKRCGVLLEANTQQAYDTKIEEIAGTELKSSPRGMSHAGRRPDGNQDGSSGQMRPLNTSYQARAPLGDAHRQRCKLACKGRPAFTPAGSHSASRLYRFCHQDIPLRFVISTNSERAS